MIGSDYDSFKEFKKACFNPVGPLNSAYVLGKVYPIDQLKRLISYYNIEDKVTAKLEKENAGATRGINKRYAHAEAIADILKPKQIGEALSLLDHEFCFPVASYFQLPSSEPYKSLNSFLRIIKREFRMTSEDYSKFNGIQNPQGSSICLESIQVDRIGSSVSFLFSCNRVLLCPDGQQNNFEDYFLARIPVRATFLFALGLLEISMPFFSEVHGAALVEATNVPARFQFIIRSFEKYFSGVIDDNLIPIKFNLFTLFMETKLGAADMGWKIAPQEEAAFDLTQGVVPLRQILDVFSQSLQAEYKSRKKAYPFEEMSLYNIFRALKENSYTYSLVLEAALGKKKGAVRIATLYGRPDNTYTPVVLLDRNDKYIANQLRDFVQRSQIERIENPYDIDYIMSKS